MAAIVWDAGNILQITQSTDGYRGGTQCVGRAPSRNNNRCGWTIRDRYSEISALLRTISGTQPGSITTETLSQLAKLCLCPDWHWSQKDEVVARWRTVVRAEAQRHPAPVNNPTPALFQSVAQIQTTLTQTQQRLAEKETLILGVRRELETERLLSLQSRQNAVESENRLRLELSNWKNRFESSQDDKRSQETIISNIQISKQALEAEITRLLAESEQDKKAFDTERLSSLELRQNAAETEKQLNLELSGWKNRLQSSQDDKKSHEITISQIQSSNEILEAEVKKLLAERVQGEKELEAERLLSVQFQESAAKSENRLRLELCALENRFQSSQEDKESQETTISQIQLSNETLETERNKLLAEHEQAEKEIITLKKTLEETSTLLQDSKKEKREAREKNRALSLDLVRIRDEQADAADDLKKLHVELTASTTVNKELTAELEERDGSLRQGREDLERERARIADLEAKIARLEISEKELKASISSCWWHRSWMRLSGLQKGRSSKRRKEVLPSTSAVSHSTTTNVLYK